MDDGTRYCKYSCTSSALNGNVAGVTATDLEEDPWDDDDDDDEGADGATGGAGVASDEL
jgi:hypothetical protein